MIAHHLTSRERLLLLERVHRGWYSLSCINGHGWRAIDDYTTRPCSYVDMERKWRVRFHHRLSITTTQLSSPTAMITSQKDDRRREGIIRMTLHLPVNQHHIFIFLDSAHYWHSLHTLNFTLSGNMVTRLESSTFEPLTRLPSLRHLTLTSSFDMTLPPLKWLETMNIHKANSSMDITCYMSVMPSLLSLSCAKNVRFRLNNNDDIGYDKRWYSPLLRCITLSAPTQGRSSHCTN
jgi:hypothetical protein